MNRNSSILQQLIVNLYTALLKYSRTPHSAPYFVLSDNGTYCAAETEAASAGGASAGAAPSSVLASRALFHSANAFCVTLKVVLVRGSTKKKHEYTEIAYSFDNELC